MLSVPPARTIRASPVRMVRAAAGLPSMAEDDLVHVGRIEPGPLQRGLRRRRAEVGRREGGESAAELADGSPHRSGEVDVVVLLGIWHERPVSGMGEGPPGRTGPTSKIRSIAPEFRLALADVGVEALAGVRALEELLLKLALDGEAALERHLGAGLHGPLDPSDRLGRLVRRAELLGVLVDLAAEVVALEDVVDDADPLRLLEVDQP